jgi:hypothetical protein
MWVPPPAAFLLPAALAASGIGAVLGLHDADAGVSYMVLTRDPASTFAARPSVGFLSNLGVVGWVAAATVCFVAGALVRGRSALAPFLLAGGALTAWLAADDLWLLHEEVLPSVLGIRERTAIRAHGVFVLAIAVSFWRQALRTEWVLAAMAVALLGASAWMDTELVFGEVETLVEDSLKFAGIAFWGAYAVRVAQQAFAEALGPAGTAAGSG